MSERFITFERDSTEGVAIAEQCMKLSKDGFQFRTSWTRQEVFKNPNCPDEIIIYTWVTFLFSKPHAETGEVSHGQ